MPLYRLFVHGADHGLLDARSPDAARHLAERAAKLAAGETGIEFRVSAAGLKLAPRQHDALLAIVREYQEAIERERRNWDEGGARQVAEKTARKAHAGYRVRPSPKGWAIYFGDIAGAGPQVNVDADSVYGWFERTALRPLALEAHEVRAKAPGAV